MKSQKWICKTLHNFFRRFSEVDEKDLKYSIEFVTTW